MLYEISEENKQELITRYTNGESMESLALSELFPGNSATLKKYLVKWGAYKPKRTLDDDIDEIVELWLGGMSLCKLQEQFHHNKSTISKRLKEMGYDVKNPLLICEIDETVFDVIDSEEKAYWLGFMYADGNIKTVTDPEKKTLYRVTLALKLSDANHLYKFNKFIKHKKDNVKLRPNDKSPSCLWYVVNYHLWNALNEKGCVPQKSLVLEFPSEDIFTDKSLIRHFIRGYFDGDGSLSYDKRKETIIPRLSTLGTNSFLNEIARHANCLNSCIIEDNRSKNPIWMFKCNIEESLKFMHYLYDDCTIYLDRKYARYLCFNQDPELPLEALEWPEFVDYTK